MRPRVRNLAPGLFPVVLAAGLAFWSLNFGLPFLFRPDEDVMVGRAVRMAAEGSLDPLFANSPPLVFYVFALAERLTGQLDGLGLTVTSVHRSESHRRWPSRWRFLLFR